MALRQDSPYSGGTAPAFTEFPIMSFDTCFQPYSVVGIILFLTLFFVKNYLLYIALPFIDNVLFIIILPYIYSEIFSQHISFISLVCDRKNPYNSFIQ